MREKQSAREGILQVYPNPMSGTLFLELSEEPEAEISLGIYSLSGSLLKQEQWKSAGGRETLSWQHGLKRPGAYILKIRIYSFFGMREESRLLIYSGN